MRLLIWLVFPAGAFASRYWFGTQGRIVYALVVLAAIVLFRRQLTIGLTHVASMFGLSLEGVRQAAALHNQTLA